MQLTSLRGCSACAGRHPCVELQSTRRARACLTCASKHVTCHLTTGEAMFHPDTGDTFSFPFFLGDISRPSSFQMRLSQRTTIPLSLVRTRKWRFLPPRIPFATALPPIFVFFPWTQTPQPLRHLVFPHSARVYSTLRRSLPPWTLHRLLPTQISPKHLKAKCHK
jgi:hypothetical protein